MNFVIYQDLVHPVLDEIIKAAVGGSSSEPEIKRLISAEVVSNKEDEGLEKSGDRVEQKKKEEVAEGQKKEEEIAKGLEKEEEIVEGQKKEEEVVEGQNNEEEGVEGQKKKDRKMVDVEQAVIVVPTGGMSVEGVSIATLTTMVEEGQLLELGGTEEVTGDGTEGCSPRSSPSSEGSKRHTVEQVGTSITSQSAGTHGFLYSSMF